MGNSENRLINKIENRKENVKNTDTYFLPEYQKAPADKEKEIWHHSRHEL